MGTVNVVLGEDTRLNLILGQQLENAVTSVVFDFSAWQTTYGSGTLALSVQRPGDDQPYAVTLSTSGTDATWSVTNLDTAYKGVGHIQLTYTVGSAIKKSVVYKFTVYESLGANGEYPSPGQTWQEGIEDDIEGLRTDVDADHDELIDIREGADGVTYPSAGDAVRSQITDVKSDLSDISESREIQTELEYETVAGLYIGSQKYGSANASTFFVHYIPVVAGKKYRVTAFPIKTRFAEYGLVAFSENVPANQTALSVLVAGSTEAINVDYIYTATANGYLGVATIVSVSTVLHFYEINEVYHVITDKMLLDENMPADAKATGDRFDLLGYGTTTKDDTVSSSNEVVDRYIAENGKISTAGSNNFAVAWYPVMTGKQYTISGLASVGGSGQALVCFDNVYDSTTGHVCKSVIQTATTTDTEYDITYTPTEDGYIVMPKISRNKLVVKLVSDTDYQRIYDIEKSIEDIEAEIGKTKMDVKIQLFGDSITDNLWGDKLTWANYIPQNLSEYNVTVVNDAVGGSGIGHGASKGTTESHQEEDYNFVWDLVTDGTTLQTDADYIVILVGTNNWTSGTDLGDMSSTGNATIYGALKGILDYISQHSGATVFVCTIPQRYNTADQSKETNAYGEPLNADGVSLADYCEAFRKVSAFYGMPCVHLNEALGWNRLNISNFSGDGLHPNAKGDKMISAFICNEIKKHIGNVSYA